MTHAPLFRAALLAGAAIQILGGRALAQEVHVHGIDSLHVRANVQPRFDTTTADGEPSSAWELRRARIGIRMFAAGWIRGEVEGDFGRGRARMTDGNVRLDFDPRFRLRAGQFKKPFDTLELVSSRELLLTERDGLPRGVEAPTPNGLSNAAGYANRDIGLEWSGVFGPATVTAGAWNGAGANANETDDGKQLGARAEIAGPAGWRLVGAWGGIRRSDADTTLVDEGTWSHAFELAAVTGRYGEPGLKALVQLMAGDGRPVPVAGASPLEPRFTAFQAIAAWNVPVYQVPYLIAVEPAARFGWADPDDDGDDDEATLWSAGVNLYHHEHVKTQVHFDHVRPEAGGSETAFRLQAVLGF